MTLNDGRHCASRRIAIPPAPSFDILSNLWAAAEKAGPFATLVLLIMWWFERGERKDWQDRTLKLHGEINERVTAVLNKAANSIRDLQAYIGLRQQRRRE